MHETPTLEMQGIAPDSGTIEAPAPLDNHSPLAKTLLRIVITAAVLALLFWQVSWNSVWHAISSLSGEHLAFVCLLCAPTQYFQFLRWSYLARQAGPGVRRADVHRGYWVGYTLGLITPGRIGMYGRALALRDCSLARAGGLTIVERSYGWFVLNGLGLIALVVLPALGWSSPVPVPGGVISVLLIGAGVAMLALGVFPSLLARGMRRIVYRLPLSDKLERALSAVQEITTAQGLLLTLLAAAALASSLLQFVLIVRGMGVDIPFAAGMLAVLLNFFLKSMIPISIGSVGVGEWTAMLCLAGLGVGSSVAVAASLLLFFLNVFLPALVGLPFLASLRRLPSFKQNPGVP